jgi:hypothetical protein
LLLIRPPGLAQERREAQVAEGSLESSR